MSLASEHLSKLLKGGRGKIPSLPQFLCSWLISDGYINCFKYHRPQILSPNKPQCSKEETPKFMNFKSLIQTSLVYKSPRLPIQLHTSAQVPNGSHRKPEKCWLHISIIVPLVSFPLEVSFPPPPHTFADHYYLTLKFTYCLFSAQTQIPVLCSGGQPEKTHSNCRSPSLSRW